LACRHCRASAKNTPYDGELTTEQAFKVLESIASFSKPIIILTGGEPMNRPDIYEIARHGTELGLRMVMAPCGLQVDSNTVTKIIDSGIKRISLSLDGMDAKTHDSFRGVKGAFESVMKAAEAAKSGGLEFQINSTITKLNYKQLPQILELVMQMGAVSFHPFLLVPTGRAENLVQYEINPEEYEEILLWIYQKSRHLPIQMKPTCAPHYYRILRQEEKKAGRNVIPSTHGLDALTKGCMGGQSFAFISHIGKVQICGFMEDEAGDLKKSNLDFHPIWDSSELFNEMRDLDSYHGKCGICDFRKNCGGCRARAKAISGDYLGEEPFCIYQPT
jgi:heme b synthase